MVAGTPPRSLWSAGHLLYLLNTGPYIITISSPAWSAIQQSYETFFLLQRCELTSLSIALRVTIHV